MFQRRSKNSSAVFYYTLTKSQTFNNFSKIKNKILSILLLYTLPLIGEEDSKDSQEGLQVMEKRALVHVVAMSSLKLFVVILSKQDNFVNRLSSDKY